MQNVLTSLSIPLTQFLQSRRAWLSVLAIVAVAVLTGFGRVSAQDFVAFLKWTVTVWVGSMAAETSALYLGPNSNESPPKPPSVDPGKGTSSNG